MLDRNVLVGQRIRALRMQRGSEPKPGREKDRNQPVAFEQYRGRA